MANEYVLSYTATDINERLGKIDSLAEKSELPSKLSELTNDRGFATETYVDNQIAAIPTPDVSGQISTHNTATNAHNDIRLLINNINTNKINTSDIIDNLTTNVNNKPLSAAQGVALKGLIDDIVMPSKISELENDSGYITSLVQPDWNEVDETSFAYIKNKPDIAEQIDALKVVKTINGIEPDENGNVEVATSSGNITIDGETLVLSDGISAIIENETLIL